MKTQLLDDWMIEKKNVWYVKVSRGGWILGPIIEIHNLTRPRLEQIMEGKQIGW